MIDQILHYGTLWGLILSTASVAVAVLLQQRQTNATIYLELTARLFQFFHSMSIELRAARLSGEAPSPEQQAEISVACYEYLSLVCSAYQLYQGHYFSGRLWQMLCRDIERILKTPIVRAEWGKVKPEFTSFPNFIRYVDRIQSHA